MSDQQPPVDAEFEEISEQRRADRRASDRRTVRVTLDPLFATTLVNQIAAPEEAHTEGYAAPKLKPRRGVVVNVTA
ncbi:MAG: hypothetical protein J0L81_13395 [Caulobacterales bacterium]|jgi:hypothetical protein|nr:hypothetical protein [Caulobacterales bacterium]